MIGERADMENCFIFGAGKDTGLVCRPGPGDYVIAADGGYLACRRAGIVPLPSALLRENRSEGIPMQ